MAEVYIFPEGSAYIFSGNSNQSALIAFARSINVTVQRAWEGYRPPFSNQYTYIQTGLAARVSVTQALSQKDLKAFFTNTTGGQLHMHIFDLTPGINTSAGVRVWSGFAGQFQVNRAQGEQTLSFDATFRAFSAY